jgi:hypothetical protein
MPYKINILAIKEEGLRPLPTPPQLSEEFPCLLPKLRSNLVLQKFK